ncbi:MAG: ABC transporter ATP-binding protein [Nitratireductor sp.]|nr:ABC transporter ATP-binding protein [Nitratireductor sp.]MCB1459923.1 ABC transporter ATP-binding protein [Nitratireductor sp.]
MSEPVLAIRDVRRAYREGARELVVLEHADLDLHAGELVALVAPSGTGKSTLLHLAGLLERPDGGEVHIAGKATRTMADRQRTMIRRNELGFVYQFHHLLPEFSAIENLMVPQLIRGVSKQVARERAGELLDYMRIGERALHRPAELSGGEQQRVAIARAVANAPRLLLADEPTGNLDPETSGHVFSMLETLVRSTGLAALVATHNHELARRMDRCVTLDHGRIAAYRP